MLWASRSEAWDATEAGIAGIPSPRRKLPASTPRVRRVRMLAVLNMSLAEMPKAAAPLAPNTASIDRLPAILLSHHGHLSLACASNTLQW
jgi:hypothetical protein